MSRLSGRRSRPLGVELPVVVRSTSRVYDAARYGGKVRVRWVRKWKQRTRPPSRLLPEDVYTARCPDDLADLFERLEEEYLAFAAAIHFSYESAP
jgi:vWA-MoxR associated protein C-terminal domain